MGAEGSRFKSGCPDFFMGLLMQGAAVKLPYLTFYHRPCRGYEISGDEGQHIILSPVCESTVEFSSLVLSVNYPVREKDWLLSEVQVCQNGCWSKFYKLALYSKQLSHSFPQEEDEFARLCVDVLHLKKPAQAYRFRLTIQGHACLPEVFICLTDAHAEKDPCFDLLPAGEKILPVEPISQMQLPVTLNDRARMCSPASLTMALHALGLKSEVLQTSAGVYDDRAGIYGNWTLNTAYACTCGAEAFVTRFQRLSQLKEFLNKESMILASISYARGALTGAAIVQTPGHLVLLVGWKDGKIYVADPAAENTKDVLRFYDAGQFARAWLLNKRGLAYLVRKK